MWPPFVDLSKDECVRILRRLGEGKSSFIFFLTFLDLFNLLLCFFISFILYSCIFSSSCHLRKVRICFTINIVSLSHQKCLGVIRPEKLTRGDKRAPFWWRRLGNSCRRMLYCIIPSTCADITAEQHLGGKIVNGNEPFTSFNLLLTFTYNLNLVYYHELTRSKTWFLAQKHAM